MFKERAADPLMPMVILAVVAASTICQFLILDAVPETPANDLAKHVAAILNFQSAFLNAQWLPRLQ